MIKVYRNFAPKTLYSFIPVAVALSEYCQTIILIPLDVPLYWTTYGDTERHFSIVSVLEFVHARTMRIFQLRRRYWLVFNCILGWARGGCWPLQNECCVRKSKTLDSFLKCSLKWRFILIWKHNPLRSRPLRETSSNGWKEHELHKSVMHISVLIRNILH